MYVNVNYRWYTRFKEIPTEGKSGVWRAFEAARWKLKPTPIRYERGFEKRDRPETPERDHNSRLRGERQHTHRRRKLTRNWLLAYTCSGATPYVRGLRVGGGRTAVHKRPACHDPGKLISHY
ncbi:hypothetical protein EVAR_98059_1 [Eumeta japonica]|uniref:Uncharacterized protein n=1 Tax=Eumeta variegata TaxID=151549 RepID=A0A4C1WFH4_EUMVA|nr:hypothetical protein EVAR_98059_1 [Eumeta japonica]